MTEEHETRLGRHVLDAVREESRRLRRLAEHALAQVDDETLHRRLDPESNSIAVLVRHIGGNLVSRWTDFLTTDGEKPDRHRDREFEVDAATSREELLAWWERGWSRLFEALDGVDPARLLDTVTIRGEPHTIVEALARQLAHTAQHVGQIVLLAKHFLGPRWRTPTIPRGRSEEFLRRPRPAPSDEA